MLSLVPLLQLLATYQTLSAPRPKTETTVKTLETLLAESVILPARASFLSSKRSRMGPDVATNLILCKDLLTPLSKFTLYETQEKSPVATFYSIAIRYLPRETPKQRTTEDPWLQSLFRQLVEILSSIHSPSQNLIGTVKFMLHEAVDNHLLLESSLVKMVLSEFSGLLSNDSDVLDWDLVTICLKLNSDIFIVPSPQREPNIFLTSLLTRIAGMSFELPVDHDHRYGEILFNVIIPLVQAFAHARDLPRFIDHWKEELTHEQEMIINSNAVPSIWEDDRISQAVADLVETSLTIGQVSQILLAGLADLPLHVSSNTRPLASLLILECVLNGCTSDGNIEEFTEAARSTYSSVLELFPKKDCWHTLKRWRAWRLLTTINIRWPVLLPMPELESAENDAICIAFEFLDKGASCPNFAEQLYAFNYILGFAALEVSGRQVLHRAAHQTIKRALGIILDHQEIINDLLRSEEWVTSRHRGRIPEWNGRSDGIESAEILMMVCQARTLCSPEAFQ